MCVSESEGVNESTYESDCKKSVCVREGGTITAPLPPNNSISLKGEQTEI